MSLFGQTTFLWKLLRSRSNGKHLFLVVPIGRQNTTEREMFRMPKSDKVGQ